MCHKQCRVVSDRINSRQLQLSLDMLRFTYFLYSNVWWLITSDRIIWPLNATFVYEVGTGKILLTLNIHCVSKKFTFLVLAITKSDVDQFQ